MLLITRALCDVHGAPCSPCYVARHTSPSLAAFGQAINMGKMSLPNVWPLKGTVVKAFKHYYKDKDEFRFPPAGFLLEVSYFTKLEASQVGEWERDNHDTFYLAWLMLLDEIKEDAEKLKIMKEMAQQIPMRFNRRDTPQSKLLASYQHKENEEKNIDILGHSLLARARELVGIQDCAHAVGNVDGNRQQHR